MLKKGKRYSLNNKMGNVIWFTGLSGSGKTTIAIKLKKRLEAIGKSVEILDGDVIRGTFNKHLGFSRDDIRENNKLIAELTRKSMKNFDFVLVPIISPYKEDREKARSIVGDNFFELFVNSSLKICIERDTKGLYKKALSGEIKNFIGISESNPYEPPYNPHIEVCTDQESVEESTKNILRKLTKIGCL